MKEIKLYKVTFNEYCSTYNSKTMISTAHHNLDGDYVDEKGRNLTVSISEDYETLNIPKDFIIKENEIEYYKKFGNGIRTLEYIGSMLINEKSD